MNQNVSRCSELRAGWFGVQFQLRANTFLQNVQSGPGIHRGCDSMSTREGEGGGFLGVKRPGSKVGHSPSSKAEDKNEWSYPHDPSTCHLLPLTKVWVAINEVRTTTTCHGRRAMDKTIY